MKINYYTQSLWQRFHQHQLRQLGGSLAFFFLLALFPLLISMQALLGLFGVNILELSEFVEPFMPELAFNVLLNYIQSISGERYTLLSIGFLSAIFSASIAVSSLMTAILNAYTQPNRRTWIVNKAISMLFTLMIGISMVLFLVLPVLGNWISRFISVYLPITSTIISTINSFGWVLSVVSLTLTIAMLYKIVPYTPYKQSIWPGTIFAVVGWALSSAGLAYYINNFANYAVYGLFGAVIALLLWLYLTGIMIVLGAELNDIIDDEKKSEPAN